MRKPCTLTKTALLTILGLIAAPSVSHSEKIPAQVAGAFYPSDAQELKTMVQQFITQASTQNIPGELLAALVPHAGYPYSGMVSAQFYRQLVGRQFETIIILGTGHYYGIPGAATISSGAFKTPLGDVAIDEETTTKLIAQSNLIADFPPAFEKEHSIEVQLPFLQTALKNFKIVPIVMNTNDPRVARAIGNAIAAIMKPRKMLILISSDLSHYPDSKTAETIDQTTLNALLANNPDPDYFFTANRLLMERGPKSLVCTYCGEAALNTAMNALKPLMPKTKLLIYSHSGKIPNIADPSKVVGYASLVWYRDKKTPKEIALAPATRHQLLQMARQALANKLKTNNDPQTRLFDDPILNQPAAVFVTWRQKNTPQETSLRGCIGSLVTDLPLGEAVQNYAIKSALEDRRFTPVTASELDGLSVEISKLTPFRKAVSAKSVRHGIGVLITQGKNSGLFLPSVWETLPDKTQFLEELCSQKAGLPRNCWSDPKTEIYVFDAETFEEE